MSAELQTLFERLVADARARYPERPALIGVGGSQGSGKSYQSRLYAEAHPRVAYFSLDDVYLTKAERQARAEIYSADLPAYRPGASAVTLDASTRERLKALFFTRGPPGTHDLGLASGLLARLGKPSPTPLPRFDKSQDDRATEAAWPLFEGPADAILVDGWCMGAGAPPAGEPINVVEQGDVLDVINGERSWRWQSEVAHKLKHDYAQFFAAFDAIIYLQAPSWEIVRVWRGQQEVENLGRPLNAEDEARLDRFVAHYERVTRAMLAGHHSARFVAHLDENRRVVRIEER